MCNSFELMIYISVPWGPFWTHILEAWECKDNENFLFIFYEELAQVQFI